MINFERKLKNKEKELGSIETQSRKVVARGWSGEDGELLLSGYRVKS